MIPELSVADITLWLGLCLVMLMLTTETLTGRYGKLGICLRRKRMRIFAVALLVLFLVITGIRVATL